MVIFFLESVTAVIMLYRNTKANFAHLMETQTSSTLSLVFCLEIHWHLFIIYQDYVLQKSIDLIKENVLMLKKEGSRPYPAEIIKHTDYVDDLALLANIPTQAESLLHRLEQTTGLHINTN